MPINYSKWDNLDCSSDEEDAPKIVKPAPKKVEKPVMPAPKEATGSAWNANNYHWEEQKLDKWGRQRIGDLLTDGGKKAHEELEYQGARLSFIYSVSKDEVEGDAWTHIRKGKTVVGYNFEIKLTVSGKVKTSSREEPVGANVHVDLMVDNDAEVAVELTEGGGLPFAGGLKKHVHGSVVARINAFLTELQEKALEQKSKTEGKKEGSASPLSAPPAAAVGHTEQSAGAKSHFGGRVQVGGHNIEGLRIS